MCSNQEILPYLPIKYIEILRPSFYIMRVYNQSHIKIQLNDKGLKDSDGTLKVGVTSSRI